MSDAVTRLNAALEGRYRIERELGEGGMATVYLAKDLKHNRNVALKVLKPELAAVVGAERFLAEIETTANLQHPHVLPLHDSGEADGFLYYVMPYVEGESLRERLDREKQLPVDMAVRIATDMAQALDYAHRQGVIHRDIKPANVLIHDGRPLIADFGIALAVGSSGAARLTETGINVGTPHYMSPEQATGEQSVGPATDTYALGCVLYEMLVGEPPHTGSTAQAILGSIIAGVPESVTTHRGSVPQNVAAAIARALEKVPADRFQSTAEFGKALADPAFRHGVEAQRQERSRSPLSMIGWGVAAVLVAVLAWPPATSEPDIGVVRMQGRSLAPLHSVGADFEIGPQTSGFWYRRSDAEAFYRSWNRLSGDVRIPSGPTSMSPDGQTLSIVQNGDQLVLVNAQTGSQEVIVEAGAASSARWGGDGNLYYRGSDGTIWSVHEQGGRGEPIGIGLEEGERTHRRFNLLPGGRKSVMGVGPLNRIVGLDLETGERLWGFDGTHPWVTPTGHLVYRSLAGQVMAAPLDLRTAEPIRDPVPLIEDAAAYRLASDGTLAYWRETGEEALWVTQQGTITPVDDEWVIQRAATNPGWALSPDGSRVAIKIPTADGPGNDIWIKELDNGPLRRLTTSALDETGPGWLDENTVTFLRLMPPRPANSPGTWGLYRQSADGAGEAQLVHHPENIQVAQALVRQVEGVDWIVMRKGSTAAQGLGLRGIWALRLGVDSVSIPLIDDPSYEESTPALSPDGRWIAYRDFRSGQGEVVVRPFPDVEGAYLQVSVDGGARPRWSPDGSQLHYVEGGMVMAAELETEGTLRLGGTPQSLFPRAGPGHLDASPDGRFLFMRPRDESSRLVVIFNWFEELKRLVPN